MDLLVPLYNLPPTPPIPETIIIRNVYPFERSQLRAFIEKHFTTGWADEAEMAFRRMPPTCILAIHDGHIIGFAAYDCTFNAFFGPTGVDPAHRGKGIGTALLFAALNALKSLGHAYAIIGSAGPVDFYTKTVNAIPISNSTPGPYQNLLKRD
jgi:GNAT superfamily N-acetyltransferase